MHESFLHAPSRKKNNQPGTIATGHKGVLAHLQQGGIWCDVLKA